MLIEITDKVEDDGLPTFSYNVEKSRTKCLEGFVEYLLEELKKSADAEGKIYVHRKTWANRLGIHEKTLDRYIKQLEHSNHIIKIPDTYQGSDRKKGNSLFLQIVHDPLKYQRILEDKIRNLIEDFNSYIRKP